MTDATTLTALAKLFADEAKKATKNDPLQPGDYEVAQTVTVDIKATVAKGEDETYVPTASIPIKATLGLLLQRMGFQRDAAMDMIVSAMVDASRLDGDKAKEAEADIDKALARADDLVARLPEKTRAGKTKVKGAVLFR